MGRLFSSFADKVQVSEEYATTGLLDQLQVTVNRKVKLRPEQTRKAQRGSRGMAVLFL
jgi:hypothetical protein